MADFLPFRAEVLAESEPRANAARLLARLLACLGKLGSDTATRRSGISIFRHVAIVHYYQKTVGIVRMSANGRMPGRAYCGLVMQDGQRTINPGRRPRKEMLLEPGQEGVHHACTPTISGFATSPAQSS